MDCSKASTHLTISLIKKENIVLNTTAPMPVKVTTVLNSTEILYFILGWGVYYQSGLSEHHSSVLSIF